MSNIENRGPKSTRKRRRQSGATMISTSKKNYAYDLMIPLPKVSPSIQIQDIQRRLGSTGFTHMAVVHTIFGAPKLNEDESEKALPASLWEGGKNSSRKGSKSRDKSEEDKKEKPNQERSTIKVLRRLNAVLENLSDVAHYVKRGKEEETSQSASAADTAKILQGYDLVSLCPRNEATFQSACKTATASEIIVLDYTMGRGGVQLPFKIRSTDIKSANSRNAIFEIPYAPAILNRSQRKGLIQTWYVIAWAVIFRSTNTCEAF